ncbi:hypothetical protein HN51_053102 [Arachis hypogaea]|uniref:SUN domain-containing protein n=1 Tax=Arachis hypogaea TaxID=3818 RepID=A0A6B9V4L7_ARAHY|nr:uncharacterized protein LOC107645070 isoform X1 [Arachis ipaensis]XP_025657262.1 SUN domain-containing protein 4 [Arachis hypogaea]QHN75398.1 uncharacterized protein DS421_19g635070 [Arachis hypogaea]
MQRSRKALLQRRAKTCRSYLYKLSMSLVFVLWGLIFLYSLWISRSHGYTATDADGSGELPVAVSNGNKEEDTYCKIKETDAHVSVEDLSLLSRESISSVKPGDKQTREEDEAERSESESDMLKPLGLDEFKSRAISSKIKSGTGPSGNVIHRVEPGGAEYNYASASKGAKVLASNKEAKGAANILTRDKDKYLRNPCSAEDKFVIIELSEETLVGTIEIANLEHHSSNLKTFELRASLVYPTDVWVFLGNFTASNVKQAQRFVLHEPKWVRYLNLNLQSHYGSEFYCTLSVIEVYGVDAVERMLEDLIHAPDNPFSSGEDKRAAEEDDVGQINFGGANSEVSSVNQEAVPDPVEEIRQQVGRMPGDTVLKILMQKVRFLDLNLSVLEQYMEELNSRYVNIFKVYSKDIAEKDIPIQMIRDDIRNFLHRQDAMMKHVRDLDSWKSHISMQLDHVRRDNAVLRSEVENVRENQEYLENKGVVVFLVSAIFSLLAILRLFLDTAMSIYRTLSYQKTNNSRKFCEASSPWLLLLLTCTIIIFILTI